MSRGRMLERFMVCDDMWSVSVVYGFMNIRLGSIDTLKNTKMHKYTKVCSSLSFVALILMDIAYSQ